MNGFRRRGGALVAALVTLLVVTMVAGTIVRSRVTEHRQARHSQYELQAAWLAESAIERARAQLAAAGDYRGETWQPALTAATGTSLAASVEIRVKPAEKAGAGSDAARHITAIATYPNHGARRAVVRREYTIYKPQPAASPAPREDNL